MVQDVQKTGQLPEAGPELKPLIDQATTILYDEGFEPMMKMFQDPENFPNAMATAINGVMGRIEKDNGEQPFEILAQVAMEVFKMLAEDLVQGGILPEISGSMAMQAIQQTIAMWVKQNQKRVDGNEVAEALKMMKQQITSEMGGAEPQAGAQPAAAGQAAAPAPAPAGGQ
jgi:hypothetical protein